MKRRLWILSGLALLGAAVILVPPTPGVGVTGTDHLFLGGQGGSGSSTTQPGNGGSATVRGGAAGLLGGFAGGAAGGSLTLDAGGASGTGLAGVIAVAPTFAREIQVGRAGISTRFFGTAKVEGKTILGRPGQADEIELNGVLSHHYLHFKFNPADPNHVVEVEAAPAGVTGSQLTYSAGIGGNATSVSPAGAGGPLYAVAGFGGQGTPQQPAGAGAIARFAGGTAGVNHGGGGADGGDTSIEGGVPSACAPGASCVGEAFGDVLLGVTATSQVRIGAGTNALPILLGRSTQAESYTDLKVIASPAAPASGYLRCYAVSVGGVVRLACKDAGGVETIF